MFKVIVQVKSSRKILGTTDSENSLRLPLAPFKSSISTTDVILGVWYRGSVGFANKLVRIILIHLKLAYWLQLWEYPRGWEQPRELGGGQTHRELLCCKYETIHRLYSKGVFNLPVRMAFPIPVYRALNWSFELLQGALKSIYIIHRGSILNSMKISSDSYFDLLNSTS